MCMEWVRLHPYTAALTGAFVLIVLGIILVTDRSTLPPPSGLSTWSGNAAVLGDTNPITIDAASRTNVPPLVADTYDARTLPYAPNTPVSISAGTIQNTTDSSSFNLNAFLKELARPASKAPHASTSSIEGGNSLSAWDFIPAGLISSATPQDTRTALQQALHQYGNEVGSLIQGFDAVHRDQAQVASDAMHDRQSASKQSVLAKIGEDLKLVGQGMIDITDTPSALRSAHMALAKSYIDDGEKLIAFARTLSGTDANLVVAIKTYDAAVITFTKNYVALATLFSAYGVTFRPTDQGSVFTFSPNSM